MGNIGFRELLLILLIGLLVFGTKKLRSIGQDLGGAVRDFKKAMDGADAHNPPQAPPAPPPQIQQADSSFHTQPAQPTSQTQATAQPGTVPTQPSTVPTQPGHVEPPKTHV